MPLNKLKLKDSMKNITCYLRGRQSRISYPRKGIRFFALYPPVGNIQGYEAEIYTVEFVAWANKLGFSDPTKSPEPLNAVLGKMLYDDSASSNYVPIDTEVISWNWLTGTVTLQGICKCVPNVKLFIYTPNKCIKKAKTGVELIAAERERQIAERGCDENNDRYKRDESIALAAACYATPEGKRLYPGGTPSVPLGWPWDCKCWKPGDRIRELTKAGALCAAEIDRLIAAEKEERN